MLFPSILHYCYSKIRSRNFNWAAKNKKQATSIQKPHVPCPESAHITQCGSVYLNYAKTRNSPAIVLTFILLWWPKIQPAIWQRLCAMLFIVRTYRPFGRPSALGLSVQKRCSLSRICLFWHCPEPRLRLENIYVGVYPMQFTILMLNFQLINV